jgi:alkaline phosphatase D
MCKFRIFLLLLSITFCSVAFAQQDKSNVNGEIKKKSPKQDVLTEKSSDAEQVDLISIPVTKIDTTQNITTIAFGSCNKHLKPQTMWDAVATNKPDLWIWLGDIIYADTTDMKALALMYKQLKTNPEYKKLTANTPVIGVYDDHDFGANDAGKGYPMKKSSKKILMDFLNIPANAPVRKREGAYQAYTFGKGEQKVKVIVMDTRYFRDTLLPDETKVKRYIPNMEGDVLGENQWNWLEKELKNNTANFTLLCSSVQVISDEHPHEKWGNFPNARKRLLTLIVKTKPKNLMILSGDRHMAEISKMDLQGLPYPLYDFTSSGMTHIRSGSTEANKFRVGDMIVKKNFGVLKLSWEGARPSVSMQVRTHGNELLQEIITKY